MPVIHAARAFYRRISAASLVTVSLRQLVSFHDGTKRPFEFNLCETPTITRAPVPIIIT